MAARWVRPAAWTIILVFTAFWLWFGIASAAGEDLGAGNWLAHLIAPGGLLVALAAIAWRWPRVGAALLILGGLFIAVAYPLTTGSRFPVSTVIFVVATLAIPPIVAGVLLLASRQPSVGH